MIKSVEISGLLLVSLIIQLRFAPNLDSYPIVIEPEVHCSGIVLNGTAFRLYSGQTLNFTFEFSTRAMAEASFPVNYTDSADFVYAGIFHAFQASFTYVDNVRRGYGNGSFGGNEVAGLSGHYVSTGYTRNRESYGILISGSHRIERIILFKIEGEAQGHMDVNFLSQVYLTVIEYDAGPLSWWHFLLIAVVAGALVAVGSILLLRKRRNMKLETRLASVC